MLHRRVLPALLLLGILLGLPGCGVRGSVTLRSVANGGVLRPEMRVLAYRSDDLESADVYLTDLAMQDLDPGAPLDEIAGHFVHLHLFLIPKAGSTPIESTASSVTIRYVVLARGAVGVYGGGGFLLPRGEPGDKLLGGSIRDATMKLIKANAQFHDPLGACSLKTSFRAPLDESLARLMAARLDEILALAREEPSAQRGDEAGSVTPGH
jgi:hypothetical protein